MSKHKLLLYSKNKSSLNNFLTFFIRNFNPFSPIITKLLRNKKIKEKISVLKSPHVNKTAQEHFKYVYFCMSLSFYNSEIKKELVILKKIKDKLFPDLKIIIKGVYSKKAQNVSIKTSCSNKLPITHQKNKIFLKNKLILAKTISSLKTLGYSGKNVYYSLDSSVGRAKD